MVFDAGAEFSHRSVIDVSDFNDGVRVPHGDGRDDDAATPVQGEGGGDFEFSIQDRAFALTQSGGDLIFSLFSVVGSLLPPPLHP